MKAKARIEFEYKNEKTARLVSQLLEIDNKVAPRKLRIKTKNVGVKVITNIEHDKLNTFLATIDDLLFCERLIENLIEG